MADQSVRVENDSKERVMFDLMNVIAANEQGAKDRKYFFTLFSMPQGYSQLRFKQNSRNRAAATVTFSEFDSIWLANLRHSRESSTSFSGGRVFFFVFFMPKNLRINALNQGKLQDTGKHKK